MLGRGQVEGWVRGLGTGPRVLGGMTDNRNSFAFCRTLPAPEPQGGWGLLANGKAPAPGSLEVKVKVKCSGDLRAPA